MCCLLFLRQKEIRHTYFCLITPRLTCSFYRLITKNTSKRKKITVLSRCSSFPELERKAEIVHMMEFCCLNNISQSKIFLPFNFNSITGTLCSGLFATSAAKDKILGSVPVGFISPITYT